MSCATGTNENAKAAHGCNDYSANNPDQANGGPRTSGGRLVRPHPYATVAGPALQENVAPLLSPPGRWRFWIGYQACPQAEGATWPVLQGQWNKEFGGMDE